MKFYKKKFTISREHGEALEKSIVTWKKRDSGQYIPEGEGTCALCTFNRARANEAENKCDNCVITRHTGRKGCYGTPYYEGYGTSERFGNVVKFLESLRVYKKQGIHIGDIVTIHDGSWSLTIQDNQIVEKDGVDLDSRYEVISTDVDMKVAENKFFNANNLFLREVHGNYFVFSHSSNCKLTEEPCDKCGK